MTIEILPCCVDCKTSYLPFKNDIVVLETMDNKMQPYKLWCADLLKCPDCGSRIITGFGKKEISEHYKPDFYKLLDKYETMGVLFTISGERGALEQWDRVTN